MEIALQPTDYVPHIDLLLQSLRINRERLNSKSKIAIDAKLLKSLIQAIVASGPFNEDFYLETYPDLAEAFAAGQISDLRRHYIDLGFFEGRIGAPPPVDEAYYTSLYQDVGAAVQRGDVTSGTEHYLRSGAAEGRVPNAQMKSVVDSWISVLRDEAARG